SWPVRQSLPIGISGLGEVDPIGRHRLAQLTVLGSPRPIPELKVVPHIVQLRRVKHTGGGQRVDREIRSARGPTRKVIPIGRRRTRSRGSFRPRPSTIGNDLIPKQGSEYGLVFLRRARRRIELEDRFRLILELRFDTISVRRQIRSPLCGQAL